MYIRLREISVHKRTKKIASQNLNINECASNTLVKIIKYIYITYHRDEVARLHSFHVTSLFASLFTNHLDFIALTVV